jgi:1-acyl-sn-glycerol-3-phosphate acyltransferase
MNFLKNIFARIWALWAAIWFFITLLLFFIPFCCCFLWQEPKRSNISYWLYWSWMKLYLPFVGVFIRIKGKEHFKTGSNYIVVCNHNTLMDIPVSTTRIPGPNKTIGKIEFSRVPLFGLPYKVGSVLVNRKNKNSRLQSYMQMKAVLENGIHMCIYPEGTRNKTTHPLKEFQNGAFKLAVDTNKEIMPAVLFNTNNILSNNKAFYFLPGRIEFHFLPPMPPGTNAEVLKQKVFSLMWDYIEMNK